MLALSTPHASTPTFQQLREALQRLDHEDVPAWGTMSPTAMLEHNRRFIELCDGKQPVGRVMRWMARLLGPLFLNRMLRGSPTDTPRNLRTLGVLRTEVAGDAASFLSEKQAFLTALDVVESFTDGHRHPLYGPMKADSLQALVRHHTAHHFHQFGLLEGLSGEVAEAN